MQNSAGQLADADAGFRKALELAEAANFPELEEHVHRARSDALLVRGAVANLIPLYQASVRNLIDLHLPSEALQRAEQAKARVLMDILLRGGVDERGVMTSSEAAAQDAIRKRMAQANAAVAASPSPA